jgi:hypothetical protein
VLNGKRAMERPLEFNIAGSVFAPQRMTIAQKTAIEIARLNNFDMAKVRPALDTYDERCSPCWVVLEYPDRAEVVYENDPDIVASMRNRPGRFITPA